MHKVFFLVFSFFSLYTLSTAQPTFAKDVAPIIYKHCSSCHRPGEIGPFSLTNYQEVSNWATSIRYVTQNKIMPPWKADPTYSRFMDENYLSDSQIKTIADWVDAGSPMGNPSDIPPFPDFPQNSLLGEPDLVLTFDRSYTHKGTGVDEYRYFVLPTGLTQNKKIKAIELRPGNTKIVHHALFFSDVSGKAKQYDDQTPEYGFSANENPDFDVFEVINRDQYPGYVPGQKPRRFPDGLAMDIKAGSDLVIQMHYAPWSVDETDSSSVNIFFADESEIIDRTVRDYIMLPFNLITGANSFFLQPNQIKTFEGVYTIPFDVSLIGIFPHMHYLGKNWEVYIENPDGSKTNLIKINDWDFNWQGGYYFDRYKIAKKGSKVHAFAKYDNSTGNPANPSNPPRFVTWGEGTKDEMYYLPLLFVPYKVGDENVVFENNTSSLYDLESTNIKAKIYPNPISVQQTYPAHVQFQLHTGTTVSMEIYNEAGQMVRTLFKNEYFSEGDHIVHVETSRAVKGKYFVKITTKNDAVTLPVLVVE
ncbi:MAG: T9SS type A sorting domain-containing protein [Saprospiraceae bacterium]|nr:T9SS type A sorting domain-containing protein [Saprospiraceae bacterium]